MNAVRAGAFRRWTGPLVLAVAVGVWVFPPEAFAQTIWRNPSVAAITSNAPSITTPVLAVTTSAQNVSFARTIYIAWGFYNIDACAWTLPVPATDTTSTGCVRFFNKSLGSAVRMQSFTAN